MTIMVNQARCKRCGDEPFSRHRHDYVECGCGTIAVDGGREYLRRIGDPHDIEEMSVEWDAKAVSAVTDALTWAQDNSRNRLGGVCAIARFLRDAGYEVRKSTD